jgi:hypothetical protein
MCEPLHTSSDLGLFGARIVRPASLRSRRHFRRREIRQTAEVTYGGLFKVGRVTRDRRFESGLLQRRVVRTQVQTLLRRLLALVLERVGQPVENLTICWIG